MMTHTTKRLAGRIQLKSGDEGVATVRFATAGVKDLDGDVIESGAIGVQAVKISAFGHTSWMGALPVGVGRTREEGDQMLADLAFFMDTTHGRDHFRTVKGLGDLGEWSFGFDVKESREPTDDERQHGIRRVLEQLVVFEVSPVLRGAGVGTGTLSAKCSSCGVSLGGGSAGVSRGELRAAERLLAESQRLLDRPRPPRLTFETERLASFAVGVAHKLVGYPRDVRPPELRWFAPDGERGGYVIPGRHETNVSLGQTGRELVTTLLHEAVHHRQVAEHRHRAAGVEAEADDFAGRWAAAVEAAFRWADGSPHRVVIRRSRPPWYDVPRGDVVLARAGCYTHRPHTCGPSWRRVDRP